MKKWLVFLILTQIACASSYQDLRSRSEHFRNKQFHNPAPNSKSLWKFLKMRVATEYAQWPNWVDSKYGKINPIRVHGSEIHITHINHSTVLIQAGGLNILTDPIFSERCSPVSWAGPKRVRNPGISFEKLPPVDIVLISHDHYDHLDLPTIEKLIKRDDPYFFVGLGVGKRFPSPKKVTEMDWWEKLEPKDNLTLHFVPVQHFSGRGLFDRNSTLWGGFVIDIADKKIYFGGDTGYADHFRLTYERLGAMDIALLPIGAYEPKDFMSYAHIDPAQAVQAHLDLKTKVSIGIHYGTFQLTAEKYNDPLLELNKELDLKNIPRSQFLTPEFGTVVKF